MTGNILASAVGSVACRTGVVLFVLSLLVSRLMTVGEAAPVEQVTFTKDVAPILQRSCQGCHHTGGIAPMPLTTYQEVRPYARAIKNRTSLGPRSGVMPPWYVEKNIGIQKFKDDPSLGDGEIATISKWADNGAPMGNPADMPPPRVFADAKAWQQGEPDLVVSTPAVEMKAVAGDWWGPIGATPTGLTEDRYVASVEYREVNSFEGPPNAQTVGGRSIFHHLTVRATTDDPESDDLAFPAHEVGRNGDVFEPGTGRLLKAGSKLVFSSAHLHAAGRNAKAHVEIGFKFHPRDYRPTKRLPQRLGLFGNSVNLDIKGMEPNQKFEALLVLTENAKIVAFEPHMHAAGVRMCLDAIGGADASVETLSCVGYDHGWVRVYTFADDAAPLLPKGTILRVTGYFDTTPANKNVTDPRNWSGFGHRSIDNMMNELGEIDLLTDEEFQREMAERRTKLGLKERQTVVGCPLCGQIPPPRSADAAGTERAR